MRREKLLSSNGQPSASANQQEIPFEDFKAKCLKTMTARRLRRLKR